MNKIRVIRKAHQRGPQKSCFSRNFGPWGSSHSKNYTLFWRAVAPLNFELGIKVGCVLESSGSQLKNAYNSFSVAFKTPEVFEFKVD